MKMIGRSVCGSLAWFFFYIGIQYAPISEAIVIFRTSPIWTALITIFILKKEAFSFRLIIPLFICLLGIVLITKPDFLFKSESANNTDSPYHLIGILIVFVGSFCASGV